MEKEIVEKLKFKIAISEMKEEARISMIKKRKFINKKLGIVACACMVLTSGIVFAKDIEKFIKDKFHLGKGVETAIENGYIVVPDDGYDFCNVKTIDKEGKEIGESIKVGVKVESYLMDDSNLSIEMKFKYDEHFENIINMSKLQTIILSDLIIIDEEKRILYDGGVSNKEKFEKYCFENNLNYTFGNCSENYLNSGLNTFESPETCLENEKSYIYNFYVEDENYPKSKEINLIFSEIVFNQEFSTENAVLKGNWNIKLNIPEKMYNNIEGNYNVIKCENDNFDIYAAKLTETGFELGLKINGLENPEYPIELDEEEKRFYESVIQERGRIPRDTTEAKTKFYNESPYKELYENYYTKHFPTSVDAIRLYVPWIEDTEGCYIQNSNGDKFYISETGCANQRNSFNEDGTYEFYNKFDMTKYDATDNITAIIELYGFPVKILLKRTN